MPDAGSRLHVVTLDKLTPARRAFGHALIWGSALVLALVALLQSLDVAQIVAIGFETWRPTLYAYIFWAVCLCAGQVVLRGEQGKRVLFVLPAVLFVISMVVFPLIFGLTIAFSDWNLASPEGRHFNGLDNLRQMWADPFYWNALGNMVWYVLAIAVEYAIAFGLALLLNSRDPGAQVLPRRVPHAADAVAGRGQLDGRQVDDGGPLRPARPSRAVRSAGTTRRSSAMPEIARATIMAMDAWTFIPFMMIMILAGLQAHPEGAAGGRQGRWRLGLEVVLGGHFSADAAGLDHGGDDPHHLQAEARRHHHQRHLRRARAAPPTA